MISFKGAQYPRPVILYGVYFYVRFPISYRDLDENMAQRGANLDRAIGKEGKILDFMLSERRDEATTTAFFAKTIGNNG